MILMFWVEIRQFLKIDYSNLESHIFINKYYFSYILL
jgi:hypothetical protein